jgi:inner membrane protein
MKMHPWMGKGLALGAIGVGLVIGLGMLGNVVQDRVNYRQQATEQVTQSLAGAQTLMGPVLAMQCTETWTVTSTRPVNAAADGAAADARGDGLLQRTETATRWVMRPPAQLAITGDAGMQGLKRSLYTVNTYALAATIKASWTGEPLRQPAVAGGSLACEAPVLFVAVSDARGLRSAQVRLDGQALATEPGTTHKAYPNGFHVAVPQALQPAAQGDRGDAAQPLQAEITLDLLGTQQLALVPVGGENRFALRSAWPHPSFGGRFLPAERRIGASGFDASWRLSALATRAQRQLQEGVGLCGASGGGDCLDEVSVDFIEPVDTYVLSDRAIKYGTLFVFLTFVAVGLFELLRRVRVHPIQYALVGAALCSFFLLLLSLSEHLPFGLAYATSGVACVALLSFYACHILGDVRRGLPFGALMAVMYGLLYVLLSLEQTALVVGAIALFLVLAAIMVATRKVNWYGLMGEARGPGGETVPARSDAR